MSEERETYSNTCSHRQFSRPNSVGRLVATFELSTNRVQHVQSQSSGIMYLYLLIHISYVPCTSYEKIEALPLLHLDTCAKTVVSPELSSPKPKPIRFLLFLKKRAERSLLFLLPPLAKIRYTFQEITETKRMMEEGELKLHPAPTLMARTQTQHK